MTIFPVMIDARPDYLHGNGVPRSLLLSSVETQTLLRRTYELVSAVVTDAPTVLTTFTPDAHYEEHVRRTIPNVSAVVTLAEFNEVLHRLEPSDSLLLTDPRCFSLDASNLGKLVHTTDGPRGVRHLVMVETGQQSTREHVQLDSAGRVQRIRRYYGGVTWLQARAVAGSLVPVSAALEVPLEAFRDLATLREALVTRGVVSRDINLRGGVFDLSQELGLLRLCEHHLHDLMQREPPANYTAPAPGVWIAAGCTIHPSARLYGPLILHQNVNLEENTALIGPTVVGAGSNIGRESVLARCLVAPGAVIPAKADRRHRVLCGSENGHAESASQSDETVKCLSQIIAEREPSELRLLHAADPAGRKDSARKRGQYVRVKRVVEGILALFGLIVLSPLLIPVALLVKLTSRGPLLFKHEREGMDGKPFECCKFRTMCADAHSKQRALYAESAVDGPQFKMRHDPRITPIGRWLRATNIDEIPQLLNVLMGQMSLIGPRPSPFRENQICVPWREARLAVRPGITGLWQICRHDRSDSDFHQWIHFDMLYVRHLSPWLDIKIFLATLLTFGGRWSVPVTWLIPSRALRDAYERPAMAQQHHTAGGPPPTEDESDTIGGVTES